MFRLVQCSKEVRLRKRGTGLGKKKREIVLGCLPLFSLQELTHFQDQQGEVTSSSADAAYCSINNEDQRLEKSDYFKAIAHPTSARVFIFPSLVMKEI